MKEKEWIHPNKMRFESEHKTFNQQVKCISRGNVISDTQLSGCIRPFNEVECNGYTFPPGHLQEHDLYWLNKYLPWRLKEWIRIHGKDKEFIAYTFFYHHNDKRIFIGYVITSTAEENYKVLAKEYERSNWKTISALDECIKYIAEE